MHRNGLVKTHRDAFLPILFLLTIIHADAQTNSIYARSFATKDSVMLRWAPANVEIWKAGNTNGYVIERFTTDQYFGLAGQDPTGKGTLITPAPLIPLPKNDTNWNHLVKIPENAVVFQSLYGTKSSDPKKRLQEEAIQFGLSLKSCDNSIVTAKLHGLYFADKTISSGENYVYIIRIAGLNNYSAIIPVDGKLSIVHSPEDLSCKFKSKSVMLSFKTVSSREDASGYIIERSEDSLHFTRVNPELLIFTTSQYESNKTELSYRDSFPANGKTYWYRVKTFSYFGIESVPSNVVSGHGKDEWSVYPIIDSLYSADNKTVTIQWKLSESAPAGLRNIVLLRAEKAEGPYMSLNSAVDRNNAVIKDEHPSMSNYYMLCAVSSERDSGFSYACFLGLKDETPPAVPEGLTGVIDTNGYVKLKWTSVNDPDLQGYRVFRCNSSNEEQIEVTDSILTRSEFTDSVTLNTLTRNVYYSVRSVDRMYNNSLNSPLCKLSRPDRIAPIGIVPVNAFHTDSSVILQWRNSTSNDVMKKELLRSDGKIITTLFSSKNDTITHFTDTSAVAENTYTYSILLTDSSGNKTKTDFPAIQFSPRILPAIRHFTTTIDTLNRKVDLKWDAPAAQVDRYVIYRAKKGEQLRTFKTIKGDQNSIEDATLYVGNTYEYAIKAVMKSGAETRMVKVELEY